MYLEQLLRFPSQDGCLSPSLVIVIRLFTLFGGVAEEKGGGTPVFGKYDAVSCAL